MPVMSTPKRKNQTGEPTTNGGQFAKATVRPDGDTTLDTPAKTADDKLWDGFTRPGPDRTAYFTAAGKQGIIRNDFADEYFRTHPGSRRAVLSAAAEANQKPVWPRPGFTEVVYGAGDHGSVRDEDVDAFLRDFEGSRVAGTYPLPNPAIAGNTIVDVEGGHQASVAPEVLDDFRGLTADGYQAVKAFDNNDGTEYLIGLTLCCQAAATSDGMDVVCKSCYNEVDPNLAADVEVKFARV
jgi:hypothetical protein